MITQLEPALFKKVTGLIVRDFELLVSLGVFNSALMNDAVYKFKRYEDSSLEYVGFTAITDQTSHKQNLESVASQRFQDFAWFGFDDKAL